MKFLSGAVVVWLGVAGLGAQSGTAGKTETQGKQSTPTERLALARKRLGEWMTTEPRDREEAMLKKVVKAIMAAEQPGLDALAAESKRAVDADDARAGNAVYTVVCHVGLAWLDKVEKSQMVFAGQYDDLRRLLPDVGEFYQRLLLATPQWFPITSRHKVIPALRDLYPKGPEKPVVEKIEAIARDASYQEHLRVALAYALAQWGRRGLIKKKIHKLEEQAKNENEELALLALRDLAAIHYGIRDYTIGAVVYRDFIGLAEKMGSIYPVNYYNAACCMCLTGDRRSALQFLEKCLALNSSGRVDSSMVLERKLFDTDPEIRLVRKDPKFVKMLKQAFGDEEPDRDKRESAAPR